MVVIKEMIYKQPCLYIIMEKIRIKKLESYFKNQKNIRLAYLFGSQAKNKAGKLSDIDIGIYLNEKVKNKDKTCIKIINDLTDILKSDKIDLVLMNISSPSIKFNIVKNGILLKGLIKDKIELESMIIDYYIDSEYYENIYSKALSKRLEEKGVL